MKKQHLIVMILFAACLLHHAAFAQETAVSSSTQAATPRWVCDKAYWVVQSSRQEPKKHTVYFYTNNHQLFYTEQLERVRLHIDRTRTKMRLKRALEESLLNYEAKGIFGTNQGYVSRQLRIAPAPEAQILVDKKPVSGDNPPTADAAPF